MHFHLKRGRVRRVPATHKINCYFSDFPSLLIDEISIQFDVKRVSLSFVRNFAEGNRPEGTAPCYETLLNENLLSISFPLFFFFHLPPPPSLSLSLLLARSVLAIRGGEFYLHAIKNATSLNTSNTYAGPRTPFDKLANRCPDAIKARSRVDVPLPGTEENSREVSVVVTGLLSRAFASTCCRLQSNINIIQVPRRENNSACILLFYDERDVELVFEEQKAFQGTWSRDLIPKVASGLITSCRASDEN